MESHNKPTDRDALSHIPISKEVYLLNNYKWLLIKNEEDVDYHYERRFNRKLNMYLNTYDYEKLFFDLDDNLLPIRNLKEKYIQFNASYLTDKTIIENQLNKLIDEYQKCSFAIFRDFSKPLRSHKQEIINSFIFIKDGSGKVRRLSNGPIEGYNRIPKDYRTISRR